MLSYAQSLNKMCAGVHEGVRDYADGAIKMGRTPLWYIRLEDDIAARISGVVSLYSPAETRLVLWNLVRAFHQAAHNTDPTESWLALALEACEAVGSDLPPEGGHLFPSAILFHPSKSDAEDVAEDICRIPTPLGADSPRVTASTAVHILWSRFANRLDTPDRALLAAEAVAMA